MKHVFFFIFYDYFVQVSSNLSDNIKHKILTNQSCLSLNYYHFLFIDSTCNCFSYFLSTLHAIVFLKHMHKDQVAVFSLGISICSLVLQSTQAIVILLLIKSDFISLLRPNYNLSINLCFFSRNSHNKYNTSLCFCIDKITHDFVVRIFFGKTTSSCYITVDKNQIINTHHLESEKCDNQLPYSKQPGATTIDIFSPPPPFSVTR